MPAIELTDQQAVDLIRQLPPDRRLSVLRALAGFAAEEREARMAAGAEQVRAICRERGLDWDRMSEDEREAFIDRLVHEDRKCGG